MLASEVAPFAKTGGLADVTGSLPKALAALGHEVRLVMPAYGPIEAAYAAGKWGLRALDLILQVPVAGGPMQAGVFETTLPDTGIPIYFVAERGMFNRPRIYGYDDDAYRFAFFSRAALDLVIGRLDWRPDVVQAHDWHAAPAVAWLATSGGGGGRFAALPVVLTIHNLMHQGRAARQVLHYIGVDSPPLFEEGPGEVNFMARGIYHATAINTVSPTYAREILTPEYGERLDGLLRYRQDAVHGILNGLDEEMWDPSRDPHLTAPFDASRLDVRGANKRALQERLGLPPSDAPLVAMVTRLDAQKGLDLAGHVVHLLLNGAAGDAQFVLLGSGAARFEGMFRDLQAYHTGKMAAVLRYDPALAPLVYGGSDLFLMPSRFEPCGLGQLIAMRYGSVPVVRATGGLADTVEEGVTGFTFTSYTVDAFWSAVARAVNRYRRDPEGWRDLQRTGMSRDFSWGASARGYQRLFELAAGR